MTEAFVSSSRTWSRRMSSVTRHWVAGFWRAILIPEVQDGANICYVESQTYAFSKNVFWPHVRDTIREAGKNFPGYFANSKSPRRIANHLEELMREEHGIGVSDEHAYSVKIDSDYFDES